MAASEFGHPCGKLPRINSSTVTDSTTLRLHRHLGHRWFRHVWSISHDATTQSSLPPSCFETLPGRPSPLPTQKKSIADAGLAKRISQQSLQSAARIRRTFHSAGEVHLMKQRPWGYVIPLLAPQPLCHIFHAFAQQPFRCSHCQVPL